MTRFAAIDIGSNGMRLLIAESDGQGEPIVLHNERVAVRLGHNTFLQGRLDRETSERAIEALAAFGRTAESFEVEKIQAVATAAVREADDGAIFCRRVKKATGIKVKVIDGSEEARLVHRAVRDRLGLKDEPWMVMDLGGGSLELTLADHDHIHWCESRPLGTVRMLEAYDTADHDGFVERLHEHLETFQILRVPGRIAVGHLAATGGNIEALAAMAGLRPDGEAPRLGLQRLRDIIRTLETESPSQRIEKYGFRPDRADVILPAALVYERVATLFGAQEIVVPGAGVKEGLMLDLVDSYYRPNERKKRLNRNVEDAAYGLGRAFRFEEDHHVHVTRLATQMFDDLQELHGLGPKSRRVLFAGAMLHDVGKVISDEKHHKHSAYIIDNAAFPGLSPNQLRMAAAVARYHRKALPKQGHWVYRDLSMEDRSRVDKLSAILRVADALDKRHAQTVTRMRCEVTPGALVVHIDGDGPFHLQRWAVAKKADLFERVFGRRVELQMETDHVE